MSEFPKHLPTISKVVTKARFEYEPKDNIHWRTQSYQARLTALEQIRQEYNQWKYNAQPGFQRAYSIIKR